MDCSIIFNCIIKKNYIYLLLFVEKKMKNSEG